MTIAAFASSSLRLRAVREVCRLKFGIGIDLVLASVHSKCRHYICRDCISYICCGGVE